MNLPVVAGRPANSTRFPEQQTHAFARTSYLLGFGDEHLESLDTDLFFSFLCL